MRAWKRVKASDFAHFWRAFFVMTNAPSFTLPPWMFSVSSIPARYYVVQKLKNLPEAYR